MGTKPCCDDDYVGKWCKDYEIKTNYKCCVLNHILSQQGTYRSDSSFQFANFLLKCYIGKFQKSYIIAGSRFKSGSSNQVHLCSEPKFYSSATTFFLFLVEPELFRITSSSPFSQDQHKIDPSNWNSFCRIWINDLLQEFLTEMITGGSMLSSLHPTP